MSDFKSFFMYHLFLLITMFESGGSCVITGIEFDLKIASGAINALLCTVYICTSYYNFVIMQLFQHIIVKLMYCPFFFYFMMLNKVEVLSIR